MGVGSTGYHDVICYTLSGGFNPSLYVGSSTGSAIKGGAPMDYTQEGIGSGSSLLYAPYGLAFDGAGNLYVSERSNHIIRLVRRWF